MGRRGQGQRGETRAIEPLSLASPLQVVVVDARAGDGRLAGQPVARGSVCGEDHELKGATDREHKGGRGAFALQWVAPVPLTAAAPGASLPSAKNLSTWALPWARLIARPAVRARRGQGGSKWVRPRRMYGATGDGASGRRTPAVHAAPDERRLEGERALGVKGHVEHERNLRGVGGESAQVESGSERGDPHPVLLAGVRNLGRARGGSTQVRARIGDGRVEAGAPSAPWPRSARSPCPQRCSCRGRCS